MIRSYATLMFRNEASAIVRSSDVSVDEVSSSDRAQIYNY